MSWVDRKRRGRSEFMAWVDRAVIGCCGRVERDACDAGTAMELSGETEDTALTPDDDVEEPGGGVGLELEVDAGPRVIAKDRRPGAR